MSYTKKLKRCFLILQKVKARKCSKKELFEHLEEHGFEISERTFNRDKQELRDTFEIDVLYNPNFDYYYIEESSQSMLDFLMNHIQNIILNEELIEELRKDKGLRSKIHWGRNQGLRGIDDFQKYLSAISHRYVIQFDHESYWKESNDSVLLHPYMLKEYNQRWYISGVKVSTGEMRQYGLDRISNLKITTEQFELDSEINFKSKYDDIVGVNYSEHDQTEKIILKATTMQAKYFESFPIHDSQKVISQKESALIELRIKPNFEFYQFLLSQGDSVEVIEPEFVREELKNRVNGIIEMYK